MKYTAIIWLSVLLICLSFLYIFLVTFLELPKTGEEFARFTLRYIIVAIISAIIVYVYKVRH